MTLSGKASPNASMLILSMIVSGLLLMLEEYWLSRLVRSKYAGEQDSAATDLLLVVAVAPLDDQGRVLLAQRLQGKQFAGMWEFPGGKVVPFILLKQVPCACKEPELTKTW